ncbi:hypothetical protein KEM55_006093 [Ascosphaera atra]|nr:hypothetical protein KEM55_006093 [Ascosphaera atra]
MSFLKKHLKNVQDSPFGERMRELGEEAYHLRSKVGKLGNLINPNHRHDEPHEIATDNKRTHIAKSHRYESFAPVRYGNKLKWYVDGRDYFWAVSEALERAQETIFMEDWWLSPELFLRRPPYHNQYWRLDQILKRKAEQGVRIYIIVYKEVNQALTCNSAHTKHAIRALCPPGSPGHGNIQLIRHPDHNVFENAGDMTFYWAHHEKFMVIDFALAFIGGLDMCFGRWDTHDHALSDVHPTEVREEIWPGQDFNNNRIMDFHSVEDWAANELDKTRYARMPWHDVSMGVIGDCVYDIAEHFVLRWNACKRDKYKRSSHVDWLELEGRTGEDEDLVGVQRPVYPVGDYVKLPLSPLETKPRGQQGTVTAQIVRSSADWSSGILTEHSIQNAYCEIIRNAEHFVYIENQFFITATGGDQNPIHNVIGRAIVDAIVRAGKEGRKFRVIVVIPSIPGFDGDLREDRAVGTRAIMDYQYKSICRGKNSIMGQIAAQDVNPHEHLFFFNLRSYDRLNRTEQLIRQEKESGVSYTEMQRAEAWDIMNETTHTDDNDPTDRERMNKVKHYMHNREKPTESSEDSIAKCAMQGSGKVSDQAWEGSTDLEKENFVQEELYIHDKVCIVDDKIAICGSANINDRSQLGSHDSELAIVMEDTDLIDTTMDGQPHKAGRHIASLRRALWREHLGLLPAQPLDATGDPNALPPNDCPNNYRPGWEDDLVADPLNSEVWDMWTQQATTNTQIFRQLFRADPDNHIKTFEEYDQFTPMNKKNQGHLADPFTPVDQVKKRLDDVKGHLVWMPLDFLCKAQMAEPGVAVNQFTESIYT